MSPARTETRIEFTAQQVANREHEELNPALYDFHWNQDFTECVAIRLTWWSEESYADYQADSPTSQYTYLLN